MEGCVDGAGVGVGKCSEHGKKLVYFCKGEKLRVCSKCAIVGSHQGHSVVPVEEALSELKDLLSARSKDLESKSLEQSLRLEEIDRNVTTAKEEIEMLRHQVGDDFAALRSFLEAEEKALMEEMATEAQGTLEELDRLKSECLQRMESLKRLAEPLNSTLQTDNLREILKVLNIDGAHSDGSNCCETMNDPIVRFKGEKYHGPLQYKVWKKMFQVIQTGLVYLSTIYIDNCIEAASCTNADLIDFINTTDFHLEGSSRRACGLTIPELADFGGCGGAVIAAATLPSEASAAGSVDRNIRSSQVPAWRQDFGSSSHSSFDRPDC
ncbi:zinc-binding protein A33-like isoform X2 [Rhinoraja longicauda]